jgi:hypothetical protein
MARSKLQSQFARSAVLRYGLAVSSFGVTSCLALLAQRLGFRNVEVPLTLFAVPITTRYAGPGPGALEVVLSIASLPSSDRSQQRGTRSATLSQVKSSCLVG